MDRMEQIHFLNRILLTELPAYQPWAARCPQELAAQGYPEPTVRAKLTTGYSLPCRHVLHTVGPVIHGQPRRGDREQLASCCQACLALAKKAGLRSVAFCCISTGEFHFPNQGPPSWR